MIIFVFVQKIFIPPLQGHSKGQRHPISVSTERKEVEHNRECQGVIKTEGSYDLMYK